MSAFRLPSRPHRRSFLRSIAGVLAGSTLGCRSGKDSLRDRPETESGPIDSHVHVYDPFRQQGVPWPPKDDPLLYRTVLPPDYRGQPLPRTVMGAVVVEASPWVEDNAWVLDLASRDAWIVGLVGNLPVGTPEFPDLLDRFSADPLFRGIRIRDPKPPRGMDDSAVLADLERLASRGLSLDLVHGWEILEQASRISESIPDLRIVIDHLGDLRVDGKAPPARWLRLLERAARHANVACKVSGLVEGTGMRGGRAPRDLGFYRPVLEAIWNVFGPDRLLWASNWPVCEHFAPLPAVQKVVLDFCREKGAGSEEKVLGGNARRFYGR